MEKKVCIKNKETGEVVRVNKSYASMKVELEEWNYTSKKVYKRYLDSLTPRYTPGIFGSSTKIKHSKGIPNNNNNRKSTPGRKVYYQDIHIIKVVPKGKHKYIVRRLFKTIKKNLGFNSHNAEIIKIRIDPILGTVVSSKNGHAHIKNEVVTLPKDTNVKLGVKTIKHHIKGESIKKMKEDGKQRKTNIGKRNIKY